MKLVRLIMKKMDLGFREWLATKMKNIITKKKKNWTHGPGPHGPTWSVLASNDIYNCTIQKLHRAVEKAFFG